MSVPEAYLPKGVTRNFSLSSLANLINPLSGIFGGGKDYVPGWLIDLFSTGKSPKLSTYEANRGPGKVAHLLAKITADGAVFGGAAYLLRAFMHSLDIDNIESIKAGDRASKKLETVSTRPIDPVIDVLDEDELLTEEQKLARQALAVQQSLSQPNEPIQKQESYEMALGSLPALTALASIIAAFKLADKTFDTALGNKLDTELDLARKESQDLALDRIRRNRNLVQTLQPDAEKEQVNKIASLKKEAIGEGLESAIGLLLAAIAVTGGVVGFNWHRSNSPSVAKYKAYKKGLLTYNKHRSLLENVLSSPLSDELVALLDSNLKGKKKKASPVQADIMNEVFV